MQARFYHPGFGRFTAPDPARDQHFEDTQSWNIYSYVRNSPVMSTDPTGMVDEKDAAQKKGITGTVSGTDDNSRIWSNEIHEVQAKAGAKEYNLTGLTGDALSKETARIKAENPGYKDDIKKPEGKDAATFSSVSISLTTNSHTSSSVTVTPTASLTSNFIVYWASPDSPSKAGDGTLRQHENSHAADNVAGVNNYNKDARPVTLQVPRGSAILFDRANKVMKGFRDTEQIRLRDQLLDVAKLRDTY